ncbi:MAG: DUF1398 domain-containing protein [Bacteriovoracia bacterium]
MSKAIETIQKAMETAEKVRPQIGGFPYLAEVLRSAGVVRNQWYLPSCQCVFLTKYGEVVSQGQPLVSGMFDIPKFDEKALVLALRTDQAGKSTFPEFLNAAWKAGVLNYDVDFENRTVTYYGALGESYMEEYPAVEIPQ